MNTPFEGFEPANTTPVPDVLFDQLLTELTGAELKAMLYIIRRTWGFKKNEDTISLSQFQNGITTRDGRVLDKGCGVKDRTTLIKALASLEKKGFIKSNKPLKENGEHEITLYSIRFKGEVSGSGENRLPSMDTLPHVVGKTDYPSGDIHTTPSGENPPTRSGQTRRTRNSNTIDSLQETVQQENDAASASHTPVTEPDMTCSWIAENAVQYAEYRNGARYRETERKRQIEAARAIHRDDPAITLVQFQQAYDERNDDWWQTNQGNLHVTHMRGKEKNSGMDRLHSMLDRIAAKKKPRGKPAPVRTAPPVSEEEKQEKLQRAQAALASLRAAQPVAMGGAR